MWATWLNIWWVKLKGCLKVQLTKILAFFIMMPCHWWKKSKIVSGWKKGYEEMQILPEMYLFSSDPFLKCCRGRPPGNIPELCNLDSCLNEYFHKAVDFCASYTHSLNNLDPKKFSTAIPNKWTSYYLCIFDPIDGISPSSEQIICDRYDVLTSIKYIVEAESCTIPDVKNVKTCGMGGEGKFGGVRTQIMG